MALSEDDIAAFVANWEPKPDNIRRVAEELDLGLDSFVFVDDNPAEREIVRQLLPEVEVVELPSDPSGYIAAVADSLLFEVVSITAEDWQRTDQYRTRSSTRKLLDTASSIEEFHASLSMEAELFAFDEMHLPRVVQLINKTNQFNLTTRRHGEESVRAFMADPSTVTLAFKLRDRLADHGLIAAVVAVAADDAYEIDTWVMSCRVIGRTVERTVLAWLIDAARDRGFSRIIGRYIPTPKNALVSDLFGVLGFERGPNSGEMQTWHLAVPSSTPVNPFIEEHNG
jgi:FkbH-like protein